MSFIAYAWIASILFGFDVLLSKITSKYAIPNKWLFNFLWAFFLALFTVPFALSGGAAIPLVWTDILLAGLFSGLTYALYIIALYALDISVLSPLFSLRVAFSVLFGTLLVGEVLSLPQLFWISTIFLAGIFVSVDEKMSWRAFFQPSMGVALVLMVVLSLMGVFVKRAMQVETYWTVTLLVNILSWLVLFPTIPLFWRDIPRISAKQIGIIILIALFAMTGTLAANKAYAENVSISSAIISLPLSMSITVILSQVMPQFLEHHTRRVYAIRFLSAGIMFYAALQLSF